MPQRIGDWRRHAKGELQTKAAENWPDCCLSYRRVDGLNRCPACAFRRRLTCSSHDRFDSTQRKPFTIMPKPTTASIAAHSIPYSATELARRTLPTVVVMASLLYLAGMPTGAEASEQEGGSDQKTGLAHNLPPVYSTRSAIGSESRSITNPASRLAPFAT